MFSQFPYIRAAGHGQFSGAALYHAWVLVFGDVVGAPHCQLLLDETLSNGLLLHFISIKLHCSKITLFVWRERRHPFFKRHWGDDWLHITQQPRQLVDTQFGPGIQHFVWLEMLWQQLANTAL
jgi:hypothetical protein